ncbi:MAG TPA: TIGR03619 family F420-dependent LLM class oxidoreductase [Acidimicrobiales bacterium]|nr:TIGR03619 family F420-dependent LLM class oxidoreductase [Acidimicrobiales bacterium]
MAAVSVVPPGKLAYGMQLQVQSQSRLYAEEWEQEAGRDELAAIVRKADECGFFYVAVCDHVAIPRPFDAQMRTTWFDTVATLGWIAALTERVRILSHVYVLAYRHPLVAAKSFMTLDHLSGGRLIVGVGAGHLQAEFELLGADFARRGEVCDQSIDVLRAAFSSEYPEADTGRFKVSGAGMSPRPVQDRVPIWVGGSSRPALRRAAERGDGWLPQGTPRAQMPDQIAYLLEHRAAKLGDEPIDIGAVTEVLYVGRPSWDVGSRTLAGPPEQLADSLRDFARMGVNHIQVRFRNRSVGELLEQMERFGAEVAPLLGP